MSDNYNELDVSSASGGNSDVVPVNFVSNMLNPTTPRVMSQVQNTAGDITPCGALIADTYSTIIDITTKGSIQYLAWYCANSTNRTITAKLSLDGNAVYEYAMNVGGTGTGVVIIGAYGVSGSGLQMSLDNVLFNSGLKFEIKSNLTETNGINIKKYVRYI